MNDKTTRTQIFFNPECSKCRLTLNLLNDHDVSPDVIEYLSTPPDFNTLKHLLQLLGLPADSLMRKGESIYNELGLANKDLDENELIQTMVDNPVLIERPIVVHNGKAIIGRPPERVLDIL